MKRRYEPEVGASLRVCNANEATRTKPPCRARLLMSWKRNELHKYGESMCATLPHAHVMVVIENQNARGFSIRDMSHTANYITTVLFLDERPPASGCRLALSHIYES